MEIEEREKLYQSLIGQISDIYQQGRTKVAQTVNTHLLETYWQIGQYIVEFEQGGEKKLNMEKPCLRSFPKICLFYMEKDLVVVTLAI